MAIRKRPDSAKPGGGKKKPGYGTGAKRDGFKSGSAYKGKSSGSGDDKPRFRAKPAGDKPYARKTSDSGEFRKKTGFGAPRSGSAPYKKREGDEGARPYKKPTGRSFEKREGSYGDRKPSGGAPRKFGSDSGKKDFGAPRKYAAKAGGSSYVRKDRSDSDRTPRKYGDKPTGDRYVRKEGSGSERAPRKYGDKPTGDRYVRKDRSDSDRAPRKYGDKPTGDRYVRKERSDSDRAPRKYGDKPTGDRYVRKERSDSDRAPRKYGDKPAGERYVRKERSDSDRPTTRAPRKFDGDKPATGRPRKYADKPASESYVRKDSSDTDRPTTFDPRKTEEGDKPAFRKPTGFKTRSVAGARKESDSEPRRRFEKPAYGAKPRTRSRAKDAEGDMLSESGTIRLNRYISNAGICSRREADKLIGAGLVSVNGTIVTEMGFQVNPGDVVKYNNSKLSTEKKVYLLMNKPKDMITTLDDPDKRKIVTDLLKGEDLPRVYPVGRLDRNTTGVLLLTNDGEMAQRLMHPKYEVQKIYKATLDKNFKGEDLWTLTQGVELEDGFIKPDSIAVPDPSVKNEVGIEIHSGRNRIIHRMFEHVGYSLDKLDRVLYAGLSRKSLKRGEWRMLEDREVAALKKLVKLK